LYIIRRERERKGGLLVAAHIQQLLRLIIYRTKSHALLLYIYNHTHVIHTQQNNYTSNIQCTHTYNQVTQHTRTTLLHICNICSPKLLLTFARTEKNRRAYKKSTKPLPPLYYLLLERYSTSNHLITTLSPFHYLRIT